MLLFDIWSNFSNISEYTKDAFGAVDPWFYPLIFVGIIGFLYTSMNSLTVAVVGILITFGLFGATTSVFEGVSEISMFLYIIAIVGMALLVVTFFIKRRD